MGSAGRLRSSSVTSGIRKVFESACIRNDGRTRIPAFTACRLNQNRIADCHEECASLPRFRSTIYPSIYSASGDHELWRYSSTGTKTGAAAISSLLVSIIVRRKSKWNRQIKNLQLASEISTKSFHYNR